MGSSVLPLGYLKAALLPGMVGHGGAGLGGAPAEPHPFHKVAIINSIREAEAGNQKFT
jgi:hypothetical protein